MIEIAHRGRIASRSVESLAKHSAAQKRQRAARRAWNRSSLPGWIKRENYRELIWPRLAKVPYRQSTQRVRRICLKDTEGLARATPDALAGAIKACGRLKPFLVVDDAALQFLEDWSEKGAWCGQAFRTCIPNIVVGARKPDVCGDIEIDIEL